MGEPLTFLYITHLCNVKGPSELFALFSFFKVFLYLQSKFNVRGGELLTEPCLLAPITATDEGCCRWVDN